MCKKLKKLKRFSFSGVSEGALGTFLRFRCYVLGTKLGGVLLLWMRPKAIQLVLGRLVGCKMWQTCEKKLKKLKSFSFSRVSEGALGFCVSVATFWARKLGGALLLQMRHKAMQLVLGRLVGCKMWQTCVKSWKSWKVSVFVGFQKGVRDFFAIPLLRFGHEIRWCFAVADASQSHAACAWQARWLQDVANMRKKLKSFSFIQFV